MNITAEEARALNDEYIFKGTLNFNKIEERIREVAKKGQTSIVVNLLEIDSSSRERAYARLEEECRKNRFSIKRTRDNNYYDPREPMYGGGPSDLATISW